MGQRYVELSRGESTPPALGGLGAPVRAAAGASTQPESTEGLSGFVYEYGLRGAPPL